MAYVYTDQTLQSEHWPEPTQAAVLWERAKHWERNPPNPQSAECSHTTAPRKVTND